MNDNTFHGLIPETPRPSDYIAGVSSPLVKADVLPSGDWSSYIPNPEKQSIPFETFNCTAFSLTNVLETWLNYYIATNQLPKRQLDFLRDEGYLDSNGLVNFSDRALGSMAGTTSAGNRLTTVIDTARKFGLAANSKWSFGGNNLNEYYVKPSQEVFDQAKRFLDYFQINYEWFYNSPGNYALAIKQCPLWVALITCGGWNSPPVPWCGVQGTNHAVELVRINNVNPPVIFDSYNPFLKQLALAYEIPYALKVFITPKGETMQLINDSGTVYLVAGNQDKRVTGIANLDVLRALFGDETITAGTVPSPATQTLAPGFIIHKK